MNILVAIDSSPTAQAALAATLARDWPEASSIRLLTVIPDKQNSADISERTHILNAHRLLNRCSREIESKNPDSIVVAQIDRGDLVNSILKVAHSWPADLIIVGADDRTWISRLLFRKSVSEQIFERASCSVLVARTNATKGNVPRRVLIALDEDSLNQRSMLDTSLSLPWDDKVHFHILTVAAPNLALCNFEPNGLAVVNMIEAHEAYLSSLHTLTDELRQELEKRFDCNTFDLRVVEGTPENTILNFAKANDIDLILVGSSGKSELKRKLLGSVSQSVARNANCSVQIVRSSVTPLFQRVTEPTLTQTLNRASGF